MIRLRYKDYSAQNQNVIRRRLGVTAKTDNSAYLIRFYTLNPSFVVFSNTYPMFFFSECAKWAVSFKSCNVIGSRRGRNFSVFDMVGIQWIALLNVTLNYSYLWNQNTRLRVHCKCRRKESKARKNGCNISSSKLLNSVVNYMVLSDRHRSSDRTPFHCCS